jgi:hypothetical protein
MLITINVTADDLPPDQWDQVTSLLTQTLTSQQETTVPQGQYVATSASPDGSVTSQRASEPLQARAFIAPGIPSLQLASACSEPICPAVLSPYTPSFSLPASPLWAVEVPMGLRWRFTSASGQVVGEVSFLAERFLAVFLSYDQKVGWQVLQQEVVPGYDTLQNQFSAVFCSAGFQLLSSLQQSNSFLEIEHDHGIAGCEVSLQQITTAQPITTLDLGHFVWRFGALLAADDKAHALLPSLPIASPEEIAAVGG